jgi:hypothetical protein
MDPRRAGPLSLVLQRRKHDLMDETVRFAVSQLAFQVPSLLAYLVGLVLGVAYFGRAPIPAMLCAAACALFLVTTVGVTVAQATFIHQGVQRAALMMSALAVLGSIARAAGIGLLIAAALIDRTPQTQKGARAWSD